MVGFGDIHADQADDAGGVKGVVAGGVGRAAVLHDVRGLTAAEIKDHLGGKVQTGQGEGRVNAAFKTVARVGIDFQRAPGGGNGDRVPIGGFEENLGGVGGAAGRLAAHDPGEGQGGAVVGDQHRPGGDAVGFAVERQQGFAAHGRVDAQRAGDFGGVKDMQRAVQAIGEDVGDIDEGRDRAQADGLEPVLQPSRGGAVLDTADQATGEMRAGFGLQAGVDPDVDFAGKTGGEDGDWQGFQAAQTARGQVAGDAANAKRIGAVRGDFDMDHRVVAAAIVDESRTQRGVCGQLDDAVVIVGQHQLAFGAQHAIRFDAADYTGLQIDAGAGHMGANRRKNADQTGAGVGRAADHLNLDHGGAGTAGVGGDTAQAQAVGIGVGCGLDHLGNREGTQFFRWIINGFDL